MRLLLRIFSLLVLGVVLAVAVAWFWLLHTAPGAQFAWKRAETALAGKLAAGELSGSLASGLRVDGFRLSLPGVDITADTVSAAVDVDLLPLSVEVRDAAITALLVELSESDSPAGEPPAVRDVLERLRLPVWLRIDDLGVTDAELRLPGREQVFVVQRAGLRADWRDRIFVDQLEVRMPHAEVSASGMLELVGSQDFDLAGSATLRPALVAADDELHLQLEIAGDPDRFSLQADGEAAIGGRPAHSFGLAAEGTQAALDVGSFSVTGDDLRASGSGRVLFDDGLSASASVQLERADPSPFTQRWPAGHPVSGHVELAFEPGYLRLTDTRLAVADAGAEVLLGAVLDLDAGDVRADLSWQNVSWPPGSETPQFSSRSGALTVAGSPDDWQANGTFALALPDFEETEIDVEGYGNRTRAGLAIANAALLGGRVAGSASVAWSDARPWSVNLYATDIDTGAILEDWPGRLSGILRASGNIDSEWLRAAVVDIDGDLRGRRFSADGGIELDRGRFIAHALALSHGESHFELDGAYWAPEGITFEMSVADIGDYVSDAAGAVSGAGRLSLYEAAPFLRLDASAETLRAGEVVVSGLEIEDRGSGDGMALRAAIRADAVDIGDQRLVAPRMLLGASPDGQVVRASARYEDLAFDVRLDGAFDSWKKPTAWRGLVTGLEIDGDDTGHVELLDDASVAVSADAVDLSRLCLAGPDREQLCVAARWVERRRLEANANLARIPVVLVNRFVDTGYGFDQALSGDLRFSFVRGEGTDGAGELAISPGRIVSNLRPDLAIRTGEGSLSFDVQDGRLLAGDVSLPLPGTGSINGRFELADLGDARNSGLSGSLDAALDDITLLGVFLPDVDALDGRLRATLDIGGTLAEPVLTGNANLDGGSVDYLPIGLELRDANLSVDLAEDRFVAVSGSVLAGDGRAVIEPLTFAPGTRPPGVHVAIRGDDLTLVSVPDVSAQSDVDMTFGFDGQRLSLGGRVDVVRARVEPETLPSSKETESDDVVIVAGALPGETRRQSGDGLDIHGELAVSLGPDVRLRIDVATATVSGTTTFTWDGSPMPVANGRYVVSGEVQAFGILLRIDEGTVRFPKVPANNPSLRIRAEREIFGNTQVRQAGVLIDGTLARPTLTPYTDPPTTEERALTLLVTGSDFNLEEGVGAIDFGTYIAPRLYVSYGISLFGQENVISARYDLTEGFGVRATSGQTDSGVDLVYRIER